MPLGTEPSLQSVTLDEVTGFHDTMFTPSRMTVIAAGDATHDALAASVEAAFGGWQAAPAAASAIDPALWPLPAVPSNGSRLSIVLGPRNRSFASGTSVSHDGRRIITRCSC